MKPISYVMLTAIACASLALGLHLDGYMHDFFIFHSGFALNIVVMSLYLERK